jgi:lyso-ornithine lipid O-acyltransferase
MKTGKALARIVLLVVVLSFLVLIYGIGLLLIGYSIRLRIRYRIFLARIWGRSCARIIGMKIHTQGPVPYRPFCLVSNHLSYIDVIVYQAVTGSVLISKKEVASWPLVGILSKLIGTIFIDRNRQRDVVRVSDEIQARLNLGDSVVFFPEGTSTDGSFVAPFKSSLLNYFAVASYPVHYASLGYKANGYKANGYKVDNFDAPTMICWWGDMTFGPHFWDLLKQSNFDCFIHFGENPVTNSDRRVLTESLRDNIIRHIPVF